MWYVWDGYRWLPTKSMKDAWERGQLIACVSEWYNSCQFEIPEPFLRAFEE